MDHNKSYKNQNESALACRARAGDRAALGQLLKKNWRWIQVLVSGYTQNVCDTDDILQNVCLRVMLKIHTLREPERFRPWLATILKREALAYIRSIRPIRQLEHEPVLQDDSNIEKQLIQQEENAAFFKLLMSLPEKYRQVVLLKYYSGNQYDEIAEILGITTSAVQSQLFRARKMIAVLLEEKINHKIPRG